MVKQPLCWYLYYSSVMLCLCVGRMVCISLFKLLWTGSGRLLGFLWKRNTTVSCLEVYWINFKHQIYSTLRSTFSVLQAHWFNNAPSPPHRSDWLTVFSATVPGITCNRGSVRLIWPATPAYAHHSEENITFLRLFKVLFITIRSVRKHKALSPELTHSHLIGCLVFQLGLMSSYAVWAVSRSFSMFLLFRVIGGICKGNVSLCTAIIADLPCPKARNRGMVGRNICGHYRKCFVEVKLIKITLCYIYTYFFLLSVHLA